MIVRYKCNYQVFMNISPTDGHTSQFCSIAYYCNKEHLRKVVFVQPFFTRCLTIVMACKQRKLYRAPVSHIHSFTPTPTSPSFHQLIHTECNIMIIVAILKATSPRSQGADPPPFLYVQRGRQKSVERRNYPPSPHWDRRGIQPNHIKFRTCSALAPM